MIKNIVLDDNELNLLSVALLDRIGKLSGLIKVGNGTKSIIQKNKEYKELFDKLFSK